MTWVQLTGDQTGGAPILSYYLQWDNGSNGADWFDVVGFNDPYLLSAFIVSSEVYGGLTYQFRIKALNAHGWQQDWSSVTSIKANQKPDQITALSTSIVSQTLVRLEWTAPHDGNDNITSYEIFIRTSAGTTFEHDLTNCSGANPALTQCDIPMTTLRAAPFNLK